MKKLSQILLVILLLNLSFYPMYEAKASTDGALEGAAVVTGVATAAGVAGLGSTLYVSGLALGPVGWVVVGGLVIASILDGDFFGFGGSKKPKNAKEAIEMCVKRPAKPGEVSAIESDARKQGLSNDQTVGAICGSFEAMNNAEGSLADEPTSSIEEFLWDPASEGNGKVLVLLPASYKEGTIAVGIVQNGQLTERGIFSGDYHNGGRPHYRFSKTGREYGTNIEVVAATTNGDCSWTIPDGSQVFKGTSGNKKDPNAAAEGAAGADLESASCKVSDQEVYTGETVTLEPENASDSYTYSWSGTGINQTGPSLKVEYEKVGDYTVSMTARNTAGETKVVECPKITVTKAEELAVECKVSDVTPAVDDEIDIWAEISGGTTPYTIKWSGDDSKFNDFDDEVADNTVEVRKKGNFKLKVTVTDANDEEAKDSCTTIKATSDGVDDDVIVRVTSDNTNVSSTGTTVNNGGNVSSNAYYRDLTVGSQGSDVTALQQYLVSKGYLVMPAGVPYGYFGEVTRAAVARWQTAMGVSPAAGYFGAKSRAAMGGYVAPVNYVAPVAQTTQPTHAAVVASECLILNSNIYLGEESTNVSRIQKFLVEAGYLVMPAGANYGYYGQSTTKALSMFMTSRGVSHQGAVVDSAVRNAIKEASCQ